MTTVAYVPATPRRSFAWLAAGLLFIFGIVLIAHLLHNRPDASNSERLQRIERLQHELHCQSNEIPVVVEFQPGLFRMHCAPEE